MTVPMEYQRARDDFEAFLAEAKEALDFTTRNPTYTTVQGVLLASRRRLTAEQILAFAGLLPPILRAIFVSDWAPSEHVASFPSAEELAVEVQALRHNHNFSPDKALPVVARILRSHIDEGALERLLRTFPEGSREFWQVKGWVRRLRQTTSAEANDESAGRKVQREKAPSRGAFPMTATLGPLSSRHNRGRGWRGA